MLLWTNLTASGGNDRKHGAGPDPAGHAGLGKWWPQLDRGVERPRHQEPGPAEPRERRQDRRGIVAEIPTELADHDAIVYPRPGLQGLRGPMAARLRGKRWLPCHLGEMLP